MHVARGSRLGGPLGRNGFKPRARRVETVKESDLPDPHFHWSAYG
nr:hypothetical protein GCM10020093_085380 [Planobispora longispora]